jgi:hypothetical protein
MQSSAATGANSYRLKAEIRPAKSGALRHTNQYERKQRAGAKYT